jgi:hypothetical protein
LFLKSVKEPKIRMGATQRTLQAQRKIPKKLSEHQIYQSKRKFFQKNYVSFLKIVNEPKICMGATRRNLQAQPKILKKGTTNPPIRIKILPKKVGLVP